MTTVAPMGSYSHVPVSHRTTRALSQKKNHPPFQQGNTRSAGPRACQQGGCGLQTKKRWTSQDKKL
eukprot:6545100-Karenia_brevis.AAC.1